MPKQNVCQRDLSTEINCVKVSKYFMRQNASQMFGARYNALTRTVRVRCQTCSANQSEPNQMTTKQVQVTHDVVMTADADALIAILQALFDASADYIAQVRSFKLAKLRKVIGTKLANDKRYAESYAAGTLTYEVHDASADADASSADCGSESADFEQSAGAANASAQQSASKTKSAKAWLHELFAKRDSAGAPVRYTLAELCALTGKSEVNVRTMLSDLRSAKYAKPYAPLHTVSTRSAGVTYYHVAA